MPVIDHRSFISLKAYKYVGYECRFWSPKAWFPVLNVTLGKFLNLSFSFLICKVGIIIVPSSQNSSVGSCVGVGADEAGRA